MALPPLVHYATVAEYRSHYERIYCRGNIQTFDGIRVYFKASKFGHSFYESTAQDGRKDIFSWVRAQRIDWIKATLENRQGGAVPRLEQGLLPVRRNSPRGRRLRGIRRCRGNGTEAGWLAESQLRDLLSSRQQHQKDQKFTGMVPSDMPPLAGR